MSLAIDAPLRDDVRLLGNLLGETLKQHHSDTLFEQVETIRSLAKRARDGNQKAEQELEQLLASLADEDTLPLTRAFTHFLNFANIAEQYHVVRQRRQLEIKANGRHPNPLHNLFERFKAGEISPDALYQQVSALKIELVLTAHPTEVSRRSLIQKYDQINDCLSDLDQRKLTPSEQRRTLEQLKQMVSAAWQTDEIRQHRPSPIDEAKWGFTTIEQTLWQAVPQFIRELDDLVYQHCGQHLPLNIAPIKFASWMGAIVMVTRMSPITLPKRCCGYHVGKPQIYFYVILRAYVGNCRFNIVRLSFVQPWAASILNRIGKYYVAYASALKPHGHGSMPRFKVKMPMTHWS